MAQKRMALREEWTWEFALNEEGNIFAQNEILSTLIYKKGGFMKFCG